MMIRPVMNGNVPDSTPALDQPMPLSRLETTTAAPNTPVSAAVAVSSVRRRDHRSSAGSLRHEPALFRADLADALDVLAS